MKNKKLLLVSMLVALAFTSCGRQDGTSSAISSSAVSSETSSASSVEASSSVVSSASEMSSSLVASSSESQYTGNVITAQKVVELILNSQYVDIINAVSNKSTLAVTGYDGGRKYVQSQQGEAKTYANNLTIGSGSLQQYFTDTPDTKYYDTYKQVKLLQDSVYTNMRVFENHIFRDETERVNILTQGSAEDMTTITSQYQSEVSCGAGLDAVEQFQYAYALGADMYFTSQNAPYGDVIQIEAEYASSEAQNQMIIYQFAYVFDSFSHGFLKEYHSNQYFYSLDRYNAATDKTTVEATYSAESITQVTSGQLSTFTGELPLDISSSFVQTIDLQASKSTIEVDEVIALKSIVSPQTAVNQELYFSSENESVARVDSDGRVTGIAPGTTRIVAHSVDSDAKGYFTITVTEKSKPDAGDDAKKADLKAALDKASNQILKKTKLINGNFVDSSTGMLIDDSQNLNAVSLSALALSNFSYDENLRKATYVGDAKLILNILPYIDNGNANLSNNYLKKDRSDTIYRDTFLGMEIYLKSDNTISYVKFDLRTDSLTPTKAFVFADLTNANIEESTGATFESGYARTLYYESVGFANEE